MDPIDLTIEELRGLYKVLEHEYIPYENEPAHSAVRKIHQYLRKNELVKSANIPTQGT